MPATTTHDIDWDTVGRAVESEVRHRMKARPRLPRQWDTVRLRSHLGLAAASALILQSPTGGLSPRKAVRDAANLLFATFPALRRQDLEWAASRVESKTSSRR